MEHVDRAGREHHSGYAGGLSRSDEGSGISWITHVGKDDGEIGVVEERAEVDARVLHRRDYSLRSGRVGQGREDPVLHDVYVRTLRSSRLYEVVVLSRKHLEDDGI